jgi:hypothetical protein
MGRRAIRSDAPFPHASLFFPASGVKQTWRNRPALRDARPDHERSMKTHKMKMITLDKKKGGEHRGCKRMTP